MLQVLLLGPVEARSGESALPLGGVKQRTLLARLATASGRPVSAHVLIDDLWGEAPPSNPEHALQAHVSRLRRSLPDLLELSGSGYRLDTGRCRVDAEHFVSLSDEGHRLLADGLADDAAHRLDEALRLWRGSPFSDLPEAGALRAEAVRLEELRHRTVSDRIDAELSSGRHETVLPEIRALVQADPLRESTWRQLMQALAGSGRVRDALAAFRRARELFVAELGLEPGGELRALHEALLRGEVPTRAPRAPVRPAEARQDRPLPPELARRVTDRVVGRDRELARLESAWRRAASGLHLVILSGDPGIGKTRLAVEFAARCHQEGSTVLFGRSDPGLQVAYQPFKEMLRAALREPGAGPSDGAPRPSPVDTATDAETPLATLMDRLADTSGATGATGAIEAESDRYRTFEGVAGWLAEVSARTPVALVVDDLHWADQQSVLLLTHLLDSPRPLRGLVIATLRDRENLEAGPGSGVVAELLRRSESITEVELTGLDRHGVRDLLAGQLGAEEPDRRSMAGITRWALEASGGNPLYLRELGRQVLDTTQVDQLPDPATVRLPSRLRGMVEARLAGLTEEARAAAQHAAVIGREFDLHVLRAAAGLDASEVDAMLSATAYLRLVEPVPGPGLRYAFTHDVVRTVLYEELPPLRRAELHGDVARVLEEDPVRHRVELAHHWSTAAGAGREGADQALHHLTLAGRDALEEQAPMTAVRRLRRARELLPPDADPQVRCDLLLVLGVAEFRSGDPAHRETLLACATLARRAGDVDRLTAAAVENCRGWWSNTSSPDLERVSVLESALALCPPEEVASRARLLAGWALENVRDPVQRRRAVARSAESVTLARETGDDAVLASTLADQYAVMFASFTDPCGCLATVQELFDLAQRRGDPMVRMQAAVGLGQVSLLLADGAAADLWIDQAVELADRLHQPARAWLARGWQVMRTAGREQLEEAERLAGEVLELGVRCHQPDAFTWYAGQLFTLRWWQGRLPELMPDIEAQVADVAKAIPSWYAAYGLALATAGRQEEAQVILDHFVATELVDLPRDILWLHGMAYLCQLSAHLGDATAAELLHRALRPYAGLAAHNGTIDAGPVSLHLAAVATTMGEPGIAACHREDAAATARQLGSPLWLRHLDGLLVHP